MLCLNGAGLRRLHRYAAQPVLVFVGSALLLAALLPVFIDRHQANTGDGGFYVRMARDPGLFVDPPWGFRILMPWLAAALPGSAERGFEVVTVLSLALTAAFLFALLRSVSGEQAAWFGLVLFLVSGPVVSALQNPYLADSLAFVFVAGGLLLAFSRRWLPLAAVLAVGVLAKEAVLFVIGAALLLGLRSRPRAPLWELGCVVAAPVAVYLLLHKTSLVFSHRWEHSYLGEVRRIIPYERAKVGLARAPIQAVLYSFGPLWAALLVGYRYLDRRWRLCLPYLLLVLSGLAVGEDWPRLLGYAFPLVIAAAVAIPMSNLRRAGVVAATLLDTAVFEALPSSIVKEAVLLAAFAIGVLAMAARGGRRDAPAPVVAIER